MNDKDKSRIVGLDGLKGQPDGRMIKLHSFPFPMPSNNLQELASMCMHPQQDPTTGVMLPAYAYSPQAGLVTYETKQALSAQQKQIDELKNEIALLKGGANV